MLSILPTDSVIAWCKEIPERGPQFVARSVNIFESKQDAQQLSALFVSLLKHFGDDESVTTSLTANMGTRGWSGSLVPYLEPERDTLNPLLEHVHGNVRRWVKEHLAYIDRQINLEAERDEERGLRIH